MALRVPEVTGLRAIRGFLPWLLTAALIDWLGTGLFLAMSTVFFVRVVGLSVSDVDSGLTIAALAALPSIALVGRLADRYGPRDMLIVTEVLQGAATSAWTLSFAIAPPENRNVYLAAFSAGRSLSRAAGPLLMTGVVLALGEAGWIALGAVFAGAAVLPVAAARMAKRQYA
jgi:Na+/melibiose symporter-like transporter